MTTLRQKFEQNGYLIVEDFFDAAYMSALDEAVCRYIRDIVPTLPPERVFFENTANQAIKSMNRLDEYDPYFAAFKRQTRFLDLAVALLGSADVVVESLQFFGKPAHDGSETPWHQDNGFQNYHPPESFMLWLALDDVTEENGCVVFARGSHRMGLVPHKPSGVIGFSQTVEQPPDVLQFPEINATMRRGSLSVHHCNTFHRSGANHTSKPRRALAINFRTARATADLQARARIKEEVARLLRESAAQAGTGGAPR